MLILVKSKTEGYEGDFYTIVVCKPEEVEALFEDEATQILETWTDPEDIEYVLEAVYPSGVFFSQVEP